MNTLINMGYQVVLYSMLGFAILCAISLGMKIIYIYSEYKEYKRLHNRKLVEEFWYALAYFIISVILLVAVWGMGSPVDPASNLYDWQITDPRGVTR